MTENSPVSEDVFPVYMINCKSSLDTISDYIETFKRKNSTIGPMRVHYKWDKNEGKIFETSLTIIVLSRDIFDSIENAVFFRKSHKIEIDKFQLKNYHYPKDYQEEVIHIKIPDDMKADYAEHEIINRIKDFMNLEKLKIEEDVFIFIPLKSRVIGNSKGFANITFRKSLSTNCKAMLLVLLKDSPWNNENNERMDANWKIPYDKNKKNNENKVPVKDSSKIPNKNDENFSKVEITGEVSSDRAWKTVSNNKTSKIPSLENGNDSSSS